ncbi:uncharacterized protein DUF4406 [Sinorhizobium medicae]|uniref:DUF4406 domain-containing protein n=1 Tax=Sinorhizobium medicae TaxID=110321 RepID=UPI00119CDA8F|nr:DUF4406 domain-containing protein [Sinorhizobium medicae]MDX1068971.1 DUF4406 domain-containing protein [Sinorhizobium medicae]TWA21134.1 uncharacterized protein DUF4406 [Sinorhizobium medicae]
MEEGAGKAKPLRTPEDLGNVSAAELQASKLTSIHAAILQAWECAFGEKKIIYLSGPITTGRRMVDNIRIGGVSGDDAIIAENTAYLVGVANRLRNKSGDVVVEPASLKIAGWTQHDYLVLWEALIARHARLVVFVPDWEYSIGCVTEYAMAKARGVPTETYDGTPLYSDDAVKILSIASKNIYPDRHHPRLRRLYEAIESTIETIKTTGTT